MLKVKGLVLDFCLIYIQYLFIAFTYHIYLCYCLFLNLCMFLLLYHKSKLLKYSQQKFDETTFVGE